MKATFLSVLLFFATAGFAESVYLNNQTPHPQASAKTKMAVQWATSAQEVNEQNQAIQHSLDLSSNTLQSVSQRGKIQLNVPDHAQYFRVLVWSGEGANPDLHTNWVEVVPNKVYQLKADHLTSTRLMIGMGC
jgi:hypothetical protein